MGRMGRVTEVSLTGVVKVTHGTLSEAQIVHRLSELMPGNFQWKLVKLEGQSYKVEFPSLDDLNHALSMVCVGRQVLAVSSSLLRGRTRSLRGRPSRRFGFVF